MAWTDLIFKDKKGDDKDKRDNTQDQVVPSTTNTDKSTNLLPGLNFPILVQPVRHEPVPDSQMSTAPVVAEPIAATDFAAEEPRVDPLTENLVVELRDRVRKDAGSGYKTFHVMRERMTQAAQGANLPLSVILAAANVKPGELVEEVRTLEQNLTAAVMELEGDITTTESQETDELQNDVVVLESDVEKKTSHIAQLTEQLETLRRELRDTQQLMATKNGTIRQKKAEANGKRQRLKVARACVATQLAEEKRIFLNR